LSGSNNPRGISSELYVDILAFGPFAFDETSGELWRDGKPVALEPQPARALALLARRAGEVVSREDLRAHVWDASTHVDFELGLNYCVRRIRLALGDSAGAPTYLETLPRRGHRFVGPVVRTAAQPSRPVAAVTIETENATRVSPILVPVVRAAGRPATAAPAIVGWMAVGLVGWFVGLHYLCPARPAVGPSPHHEAAVQALHTLWQVSTLQRQP
jgi:DNA-binding winged helix-turn-helix (wHTH) protein